MFLSWAVGSAVSGPGACGWTSRLSAIFSAGMMKFCRIFGTIVSL